MKSLHVFPFVEDNSAGQEFAVKNARSAQTPCAQNNMSHAQFFF